MNSNQLLKLISLVRRTGDRAVISDSQSDGLFVIMDSDDYERLLSHTKSVKGLNEREMMDKINRDIALWRSQNDSSELNWYENDDGFYHDVDYSFDKNYSDYDFDGRFGVDYWDKATAENDLETLEDEDLFDSELNDSLNENIPFEDLERDGFVVEGENEFSDQVNVDEPMYLEPTDNSILSDEIKIPEVQIDDNFKDKSDNEQSEEGFVNDDINNIFVEEPLDDIENDTSFFEEPVN